ncbi:protein sidekick-like isoform X2 [Babylonia areolata]|uniref:protein sidekick-like isoform X2 n=1 Tax=Babylonia areolata TaxID=304850 RepID=UPI003FCF0D16
MCWKKQPTTAVHLKRTLLLFEVVLLAYQSSTEAQVLEYPPQILEQPKPGQIETEGSRKTLHCEADGNPSPLYSWLLDGNFVSVNQTYGMLRRENLQLSDAGQYRCLASNSQGAELSKAAQVKVASHRRFTQTGRQVVSVNQGWFVRLALPDINPLGMEISWEENNVPLGASTPHHSITLDNDLILLSVDNNHHNKEYHAKAEYFPTRFETTSSPYVISVRNQNNPTTIEPKIVQPPSDSQVVIRSDIELECVINARPLGSLEIRWYKERSNGTRDRITQTDKYALIMFNRRLRIRGVEKEHSGTYVCEGVLQTTGAIASVEASASLTVLEAPLLSRPLNTAIERDFSEAVMMACQAQGVPEPRLDWFFNGKNISSLGSSRYTVFPNGSMLITDLDLPDSGRYQCFATNIAGEDYFAITLKVNSEPPRITKPPENLTIVEQSDARFFCEVTGAPAPVITWKKVTSSGEEEVGFGGSFQKLRYSLVIVSVKKEYSGIYKCEAVNKKGNDSAQAHLTVITKTRIIRPPQNQTVILSSQVQFECGISQDDNTVPVWEWFFYKNGDMTNKQQLSSSGSYEILSDGTLIIYGVSAQHNGLYKCHVISAGGNDSRIASLKVIELPGKPTITSVVLNQQENNSVIVYWNQVYDGNSPLLKFIITYRQENPNGNNDGVAWDVYPGDIDASATSHVVSNLRPSRYYRFRISAVNTVGEGNASLPMPNPAIKMPTQPPSSPPRNFFCTQGGQKEIVATWDPPEESTLNGNLEGYIIRYKVANLPDSTMHEINVSSETSRSHTLTRLVAFSQYAVKIAAYNEAGIGIFTNPFFVWTHEGLPTDQPKNLVATATNSTAIHLQWDPPRPGEINGHNLGYWIEIFQNTSLFRNVFVESDPSNLEGQQKTEIAELKKYTEYTIKIACRTTPGLGPYSIPVTVKTLEDVPGPVRDLYFDNVQDRSLRVTWKPPIEINGELEGYELQYQKKKQPDTPPQEVNLPSAVTSFTIQRLDPVTNYTITVTARTSVGLGEPVSADIQSGVPPELPSPPTSLELSSVGARKALLKFFPGFDGKTSITRWIVLAKTDTTDTYEEIYSISDPTAQEIWVNNLRPYTKYQLKIIAENIVGQSRPSDPTREFETLSAPPGAPPGNVTVRPMNATALRISWTPIPRQEWNGEPRGYKIDYRMWSTETEDEDDSTVQQTEWTRLILENGLNIESYIVARLQEWMDYQIRMISYNAAGVSPFSPVTSARTRESTPSASPQSVTANAVSSTQIRVTWDPVPRLQQNGQILGYKVLYKPDDNSDTPMFEDVEGKDTVSVTLMGLRKFVWYTIQILAYTRMGDGTLSPSVQERTDEDVPGPPMIIYFPNVTYTSAIVVWTPPSEPNGIITGYKVSYRKQDDTASQTDSELGPKVYEYTVDVLERETYYIFSVTAKTRLGWGETASVPVLTMLNRDRPEKPRKPKVGSLQVHSRNITITWQPGTDNYSPVRNFTIQYKMRDGSWVVFPDAVPPSATSYTVTGLRPNTRYQFRVAATNDIGTSNYSDPSVEVRTQSDKPDGAPQNLRVVAVTRTSIRASWEQPAEDTWNGLLINYVVQYRQVQQQDFQEESVEFGTSFLLLSGLAISQTYEVQVIAVNGKGRGPPSTPATIYVGEAAPTAPPMDVQAVNKSSSTIKVSWVPPPPETQNGGLSGYKVLYYKNSTGVEEEQTRISAETHLLLESLETFTFYFISVQPYNLAGEGPRSSLKVARTSEGVPSAPQNLHFTNITMRQLTVTFQPPQQPNGYVLLYEMEYFPKHGNLYGQQPPKRVLRANETRVVVTELEKYETYIFRISANTSIGRGDAQEDEITTGPQPGSPKAPGAPSVTQQDGSLLLSWVDGEDGASPTYGYLIQNKKKEERDYLTLQQEISSEPRAVVSLTNLNPNTAYLFRVIAINDHGISDPSPASEAFVTPSFAVASMAKPFHTEWWFLVIIALTGIIVILVIISVLCLLTRHKKAGDEMKRSQTANTVISEPSEPEEGGFPTYEMRQSRRNIQPRNGSIKNIYARPPPRPSPASVAYSDDEDAMSMAKPPIPDDSSSSVTDKPSDLGDDSTEPSDEESEPESDKVPASPPPPAFSTVYANSDNVRQSWRFQNPNNAYAYTDSEADSSHYAFSLNNGQLVVNNVAGARTPLTGFSSFV